MSATDQLLEILQADVYAVLKNTPGLATANVIADDEGDIESRVARALSTVTATGGKSGLAVVVLLPEVDQAEANLPGPVMALKVEVRVLENVLLNRNATTGTLIRSSQAAMRVLGALHHQHLGGQFLYAQKNPVTPVEVKTGHVSHAVTLTSPVNGITNPEKPLGVTPDMAPGGIPATITLAQAGAPTAGQWFKLQLGAVLETWTYGPGGVAIGGSNTATADNLAAEINASSTLVSATSANAEIVLTALVPGVGGNSIIPTTNCNYLYMGDAFEGGVDGPPLLSLTCATTGVTIRYTTDGGYPSPQDGTLYTTPVELEAGTVVRAAAYKAGLNPGDVIEFTITP